MLIASVLRPFEGCTALSGAASFFRGLHRPFGGSSVVWEGVWEGQRGVGGVWAADAACWLGDDG